jgi:hypothetical protein
MSQALDMTLFARELKKVGNIDTILFLSCIGKEQYTLCFLPTKTAVTKTLMIPESTLHEDIIVRLKNHSSLSKTQFYLGNPPFVVTFYAPELNLWCFQEALCFFATCQMSKASPVRHELLI